ncbi:MAG: hypothetical protein ABIW84_08090 [Ilumatobacteraceae bacterium]
MEVPGSSPVVPTQIKLDLPMGEVAEITAIVRLGMDLDIQSALDLEEGLAHLESVSSGHRTGHSTLGALRERT